jgi:hypothetical protein
MKKSYLLVLFSLLLIPFSFSYGQFFVEDFNYAVGDSITGHGWTKHSGAAFPIFVEAGSINYTGYPSSGIGNQVTVTGGSGSREDDNMGFDSLYNNGDVIYYSFLANVASASTTQDYFIHIGNRVSPTAFTLFAARVFVQDVGGNLRFGISNTSTVMLGNTDFSYNTTYLIFVKYTINTGGADECRLWIFSTGVPISEVLAGAPEVTNDATNGQDLINAIALRQGSQAYSVLVDGIRISTQWGDLVPVELTSFTSTVAGNNVTLNWSTATETNNQGFEVERSFEGDEFTTTGFVAGHGTTTEPKSYSYTDNNLVTGSYSYRLKQVDFGGTFSYSDVVNVDVTAPAEFDLAQNYPNPFNPSTRIDFSLAVDSKVSLKVFNVLGQEVSNLLNGNLSAGSHQLNFDASALNSGVYLYRIEANGIDGANFVSVKKMILTK